MGLVESDVFLSVTIQDAHCSNWKLSANYDDKKKQYYMPSLETPFEEHWDNNTFLFDELLPFLIRFDKRQLTTEDLDKQEYYYFKNNVDEVTVVRAILERGKLLGLHKCK